MEILITEEERNKKNQVQGPMMRDGFEQNTLYTYIDPSTGGRNQGREWGHGNGGLKLSELCYVHVGI